ncbi:hypothetical protein IE81DRAFT_343651 [Ceraceosorus guamensis]|uniref:XPG-I domain-containing protein n=1 Tax=Ceraceosorus guamensis TaxID=1522189 RepID=A0A316VTW0_9BASI|nr:hypothetical protein IE81DRAFT_343651 [Ceraceosorus guamensis]PWN38935.1 hypothetical protein IE81DRAFT_343651 [Ceraceosorus guamensis]
MTRVRMLQHYGVTPYLVFDGDRLPAKAKTEADRAARRQENRTRAKTLLKQGLTKQAHDIFAKSVDVTPAMAYQLIKELRKAGVPYIVAPYEADAQLAYLEKRGDIQGIVTEDSDLLVFGCHTVLYKLEPSGDCVELRRDQLTRCKALSLHGFDDAHFRQMAILSGCDYLESIVGMGLKTAHRLLRKCDTVAKALQAARMEGMRVPKDYQERFNTAERTFVFQRVFERNSEGAVSLTTLNPLPGAEAENIDKDPCIGHEVPREQCLSLANGDLDPITREAVVDLGRVQTSSQHAATRYAKHGTTPRSPFSASRSANVPSGQRYSSHLTEKQPKMTSFFGKTTSETAVGAASSRKQVERRASSAKQSHASTGHAFTSTKSAVQLATPESSIVQRSRFFPADDETALPAQSRVATAAEQLNDDSAISSAHDAPVADCLQQRCISDKEDSGYWLGNDAGRPEASQISDLDDSSPPRSSVADGLISSPITPGRRSAERCSISPASIGARKRLRLDESSPQSEGRHGDEDEVVESPTCAKARQIVTLRSRGRIDRTDPDLFWDMHGAVREDAKLEQASRRLSSDLRSKFTFCDASSAHRSARTPMKAVTGPTASLELNNAQVPSTNALADRRNTPGLKTPHVASKTRETKAPRSATTSKPRLDFQLDSHASSNTKRTAKQDTATPRRSGISIPTPLSMSKLDSFRFMPGAVSRAHTWHPALSAPGTSNGTVNAKEGGAVAADQAPICPRIYDPVDCRQLTRCSDSEATRCSTAELPQREPLKDLSMFRFENR